jgi:hypothetical protein
LLVFALVYSCAFPEPSAAQCRETPKVLMDERTAESHLLAKKDPVLPEGPAPLVRVQKVVLLVTVDREGVICDVRAAAGPKSLRAAAARTVRKHWRYRPFLVDWKPVVARFPVTVTFVVAKAGPRVTARRPEPASREIRRIVA